MKVVVLGAGAMGCLWAVRIQASGNDVTLVDVSPEVLRSIERHGVGLEGPNGSEEVVPLKATDRPSEADEAEIVFVFVKAHHTQSAVELARPAIGPKTTVVTLQNGWGNGDVIARSVPQDRLVVGVTYESARVVAPGRTAHTSSGRTFVGPYNDTGPMERAIKVAELLTSSGLATEATSTVKMAIWDKLIHTSSILPVGALTRLTAAEMGQPGPILELIDALAGESVRIGRAMGYDIDLSERIERINTALASASGAGKGSMTQDIEAGRKTEIDVINGAVVKAGEAVKVPTLLHQAMVALIKGLERSRAA